MGVKRDENRKWFMKYGQFALCLREPKGIDQNDIDKNEICEKWLTLKLHSFEIQSPPLENFDVLFCGFVRERKKGCGCVWFFPELIYLMAFNLINFQAKKSFCLKDSMCVCVSHAIVFRCASSPFNV